MQLPVLHAERLTLRPLTDDDVETLAAFLAEPSVREWWGEDDDPHASLRHDGTAFAIEADGATAGWLAVNEEKEPGYRHAALDIVLGPGFQDRGLGSEALRTAIRWLIGERGHHRITIDPAHENARAIRAYEAVGFKPVGVLRKYERGPDGRWRDGLLMDLLAEEFAG
jgi:aminoglycoside 6'-N-acetyltransferase